MPNYRTNEDRRCNTSYSGFPNRYNSVHTTEVDTGESPESPTTWSEPVTLLEMKKYLRLIGFEDEGESPVTELSDFSLDDELLQEEITAARERLEDYTGLSFVPKTLQAIVYSGAGNVRLEQGPVTSIITFVDADNVTIDPANYTVIGSDVIKDSFNDYRIITYQAGYEVLPKRYKIAIMMWVAASYEHRGDEMLTEDIYKQAKRQAGPGAVAFF